MGSRQSAFGPVLSITAAVMGAAGLAVWGATAAHRARARSADSAQLLKSLVITGADIEALARMFASEKGKGSDRLLIELAWTQIRSTRRGESLFHRITAGSGWGPQGERAPGGGVRPVATTEEANDRFRALAGRILDGQEPSMLVGARSFFEPDVQDKVLAIAERARRKIAENQTLTRQENRLKHYYESADGIRRRWLARGQRFVDSIEGVEFYT